MSIDAAVIATVDPRATRAAAVVLERGGGAVDAAIAANAVLSVTSPHLCGIGGDLFALVHDGAAVLAVNASGRAPSGVDAAALRREGHSAMPFRHDPRSVTVPGCVDGWVLLHDAMGRLPLGELFAAAIDLAERGAEATPGLVRSAHAVDAAGRTALGEVCRQAVAPGVPVRRPGHAAALRAIAANGRDGFYRGEFGTGLIAMAPEVFAAEDLGAPSAEWVEPLALEVWGHRVYTVPPNSQGYLTLGAAAIAEANDLPDDADDPQWAHVLIESSILAAYDRHDVLHESASGASLVEQARSRHTHFDRQRASACHRRIASGDTTYLCVVDADRVGVSLIQSNGAGFGSWLVEPNTGINLHNRGIGFSLVSGHCAELRPQCRPPHTLAPAIVTRPDGNLAAVVGSAGGDAQPQIVVQLLARLLRSDVPVGKALSAGRWVLRSGPTGFDTWSGGDDDTVVVCEATAPVRWSSALRQLGHHVRTAPAGDGTFGHAHAITVATDGRAAGAAEPRTEANAAYVTVGGR